MMPANLTVQEQKYGAIPGFTPSPTVTLTQQEQKYGAIPGVERQLASQGYTPPTAPERSAVAQPDNRYTIPEFTAAELRNPARDTSVNTRVGETRNPFPDLTPAQLARNAELVGRLGSGGAGAGPSGAALPDTARGEYYGLSGQKFYDASPRQPEGAAPPDFGSMTIPQLAAYTYQGKQNAAAREAAAAEGRFGRELASKESQSAQDRASREGISARELAPRMKEQEGMGALRAAQAKLYGAQAGSEEAKSDWDKRMQVLRENLVSGKGTPEERQNVREMLGMFGGISKPTNAAERAAYISQGINPDTMQPFAFANGGAVMAYADGGSVMDEQEGAMKYARPAEVDWQNVFANPISSAISNMALKATGQGGAPTSATPMTMRPQPVDYPMTMTPEEAQRRTGISGFADGGAIGGAPIGGGTPPSLAEYGQYLHAAAQSNVPPVPYPKYIQMMQSSRDAMQATPSQFANGGEIPAIPVAGKKILGPGTGTSDSIPAVIDGHRPAALSSGEFVIPAHVVRAKGTEFFDKLLAQYAEQGETDGE